MLSVGLVSTWVYHLYDKPTYSIRKTTVDKTEPVSAPGNTFDSLHTINAATIVKLSKKLDSVTNHANSLQLLLAGKLNQIDGIKQNVNGSEKAKDPALQQLAYLQKKVKTLTKEKDILELEKIRLNDNLEQLAGVISNLQKKNKPGNR